MKEFVVTAEKTIEFRDYQEPAPKPDKVRVKAIVSGIKHGMKFVLYTGHSPRLNNRR
jgi:D-arabinose 1-dehydrogenase-like Zn-dependent alcohol dehydrogenase